MFPHGLNFSCFYQDAKRIYPIDIEDEKKFVKPKIQNLFLSVVQVFLFTNDFSLAKANI